MRSERCDFWAEGDEFDFGESVGSGIKNGDVKSESTEKENRIWVVSEYKSKRVCARFLLRVVEFMEKELGVVTIYWINKLLKKIEVNN